MTKQQRSFEERKEKGGSSFDFRQPRETECISCIVQLLLQKIKKIQLEKQVARDICLGMTSSFELLK